MSTSLRDRYLWRKRGWEWGPTSVLLSVGLRNSRGSGALAGRSGRRGHTRAEGDELAQPCGLLAATFARRLVRTLRLFVLRLLVLILLLLVLRFLVLRLLVLGLLRGGWGLVLLLRMHVVVYLLLD